MSVGMIVPRTSCESGIGKKSIFKMLWCLSFACALLVIPVDANIRENLADVVASCDDSAMTVQMNFTHPFQGIVFTLSKFYDPSCSFPVLNNTSTLELNLTLPHGSCGIKELNVSNSFIGNVSDSYIGLINIVVMHHRILDSEYDYDLNVTCDLPFSLADLNLTSTFKEPNFETWIAFEHGSSILGLINGTDEDVVLGFNAKDNGAFSDMVVMNCIGHDDETITNETMLHQLSNPYGCNTESDLVSNFTIVRNSANDTLTAYATVKNISLLAREGFYVTCGVRLCEDTCERNCSETYLENVPIYISDIATKILVIRADGSKKPDTLEQLERNRHRRSRRFVLRNKVDGINWIDLDLVSPVTANQSDDSQRTVFWADFGTQSLSDGTTKSFSKSIEKARYKRAVLRKSVVVSNEHDFIVIGSPDKVHWHDKTDGFKPVVPKFELCETDYVEKIRLGYDNSTRGNNNLSNEMSLSSFLRILVGVLILLTISAIYFCLCSKRRSSEESNVSSYLSTHYL